MARDMNWVEQGRLGAREQLRTPYELEEIAQLHDALVSDDFDWARVEEIEKALKKVQEHMTPRSFRRMIAISLVHFTSPGREAP